MRALSFHWATMATPVPGQYPHNLPWYSRFRTQLIPVGQICDEARRGKKFCASFIIARCDPPEILEPAEAQTRQNVAISLRRRRLPFGNASQKRNWPVFGVVPFNMSPVSESAPTPSGCSIG